jgi:hypothetical protein
MIPQHFVELDKMPLSPNGKIDRKILPPSLDLPMKAGESFTGPRNKEEIYLAKVWCDLLGKERVGVYDNFFEIGGYSLLSITALTRIENETKVKLNPRSFLTDNLEQIASRIKEPEADDAVVPTSEPASAASEGRQQTPVQRRHGGLFQTIRRKLSR